MSQHPDPSRTRSGYRHCPRPWQPRSGYRHCPRPWQPALLLVVLLTLLGAGATADPLQRAESFLQQHQLNRAAAGFGCP